MEAVARKIVAGGSGVYGEAPMPPHPGITPAQATLLAQYVLSVADSGAAPRRIPQQGRVTTTPRAGDGRRARGGELGAYVLRATYTDRGASGQPSISSAMGGVTPGCRACCRHDRQDRPA